MTEEYMPEYHEFDKQAFAGKLKGAKWSLIVMAVFCFAWAAYTFVTAPFGGAGVFMITPEEGPAGLVAALPLCLILTGLVGFLGTVLSRTAWVLGWTEPIANIVLIAAGLWGLWGGASTLSFGAAYTVLGVYLALYIALVALELNRRGADRWYIELIVAAVAWAIVLVNGLNHAPVNELVPAASLALFIAAWGFVYGAIALNGTVQAEEEAPVAEVA